MFHLFWTILFSSSFAATNLDLHDISVLLPLPAVGAWDQLPQGSNQTAKGTLLPLEYFKKLPPLVGVPTNEMLYKDMRVIGIRFDPCFHEGLSPVRCKTQIRMIWQPLEAVKNVTSTMDASLHVFYDLREEEFKDVLFSLSELKKDKNDLKENIPLTVNPFLKKDGLQSPYGQKFLQIVFQYTGEQNLSRITFMQLINPFVWDFGGVNIDNGKMSVITIARVNSRIQRFVNQGVRPMPVWFAGGIVPEPKDAENLNILVKDSRKLAPEHEADIVNAVRSAIRFENPSTHNPGTTDCVSCHVAQTARRWAIRQYPWLDLERTLHAEIYKSDKNLMNISPMQPHTNIMRAFGYFMNQPIVSQRTINETAEVIKYLNSQVQ